MLSPVAGGVVVVSPPVAGGVVVVSPPVAGGVVVVSPPVAGGVVVVSPPVAGCCSGGFELLLPLPGESGDSELPESCLLFDKCLREVSPTKRRLPRQG